MKFKNFIVLFAVFLTGIMLGAVWVYVAKVQETKKELNDLKEELSGLFVSNSGWIISVAVQLREGDSKKILDYLDTKALPLTVRAMNGEFKDNTNAPYYLWRIKKYAHDFSITFDGKTNEILNAIPEKRPINPSKIGNE